MAVDKKGRENVVPISARVSKDQARLLPQNIEAETALIACLLVNPEHTLRVCAGTLPRHFFRALHRLIWEAALDLHGHGITPDSITIPTWLREHGHDTEASEAITFPISGMPSSMAARHYGEIVRRTARQRLMIAFATSLAEVAYTEPDGMVDYWHGAQVTLSEELTEEEEGSSGRYVLLSDLEVEAMQPSRGILGDILYEDTLAFMYGPPGRWKSFVSLSWALSIATGRDWFGRPVKQGDVVYVAAEGARGIGKRITAWKRRNGFVGVETRLKVLGVPVQLLQPERVQSLIMAIEAAGVNPTLIVIDTLARSMAGGDENATKDANLAIDAAGVIKAAFSCCVLLVHHPGKNAALGLRGASALTGAADVIIRVSGADDKPRLDVGETVTLTSEKPKDESPFSDIYLTTERESWATDDGETVSSLVLIQTSKPTGDEQKPVRLNDAARKAIEALKSSPTGLTWGSWRGLSGLDKNAFNYALDILRTSRLITRVGDLYRVVDIDDTG